MASETIKALLMIIIFCGLQAALHLPQLINSRTMKRWRRAVVLQWPRSIARAPISYGLMPVRVGRNRR